MLLQGSIAVFATTVFSLLLTSTFICSFVDSTPTVGSSRGGSPEPLALSVSSPSWSYSDHVISGFDSRKQNVVSRIQMEKNEDSRRPEVMKKVKVTSNEADASSHVIRPQVLPPAAPEAQRIEKVLSEVVQSVASLQDLVNYLKYQNRAMYKQMKKMQMKQCDASSSSSSSNSRQENDQNALQQDEGRNSINGFGIHSDRPISGGFQQDGALWSPRWNPGAIGGGAMIASTAMAGNDLCPAQFVYNAETERCYKMSGDRVTWKMARERCRWSKSSLVSIDSAREQRAVVDIIRSSAEKQHCDFWIGLTRHGPMSAKDWYWEGDGHLPSYTNWNENEPNNGNGDENCAQMLWVFNWRWNDAPCARDNACFVCETRPLTTPT